MSWRLGLQRAFRGDTVQPVTGWLDSRWVSMWEAQHLAHSEILTVAPTLTTHWGRSPRSAMMVHTHSRMEMCVTIHWYIVKPGRRCYSGDVSKLLQEGWTQHWICQELLGSLSQNAYPSWSTAHQTQKTRAKFKYDSMLFDIRALMYLLAAKLGEKGLF